MPQGGLLFRACTQAALVAIQRQLVDVTLLPED